MVVDELHTFDGAQGTDLALLLRRLRARLRTPAGHLICVGTSATLGDTLDTESLREYARQVFGVPFDESSVITVHGVDEEVVQSFIAALQLGLKKRFGGKVDYLRIGTQEEPGRDGGPRRAYVLLYDSVPGGTGYLHPLLAQDATTLVDVFKQALEAITHCPCNLEAEKDGCYRCVYQYRQGRAMELVSRDRAREVLTELVSATDQLEVCSMGSCRRSWLACKSSWRPMCRHRTR